MNLRYEFKYRLSDAMAARVISTVETQMGRDAHTPEGGDGRYQVRSLYFDTPSLECYDSKLAGIWSRLKVRVRGYGNESKPGDAVFLELKHKKGAFVFKSRLRLPPEAPAKGDGERLLTWLRQHWRPGDIESERDVWRALCWPGLRPTVLVSYFRRAYNDHSVSRTRVTFDSQVSGRGTTVLLPYRGGFGLRPAIPGVVLEIKFTRSLPAWLQMLIQSLNLEAEAVSKYTHVMDTCAPLFESRRGHALIDEGLTWPATAFLYHAPRRRSS